MIPETSITTNPLKGLNGFDDKNPKAVADKVQAMFLEVMLKSMEDSVGAEDGLMGGGSHSEIYRGMFREQLASALASRLEGPLRDLLEKGMSREKGVIPGADVVAPNPPSTPERAATAATPVRQEHAADHEDHGLPVAGRITSNVGWRRDPFTGQEKFHKGTDIAAAAGTPIQAVAGGVVVESGTKGGYGNTVVIQSDDGRRMLYAHNQQNFVRVGDRVVRGDAIAAVGATGRATGPHVHFEVTE